jgi:hypothetical protein
MTGASHTMTADRPLLALTAHASAQGAPSPRARGRRHPRYRRSRPRGSEIRGLIAELKQLTRAADRLRLEGADAALSAKLIDIEQKQSQLAEAVRRDPTFAGG